MTRAILLLSILPGCVISTGLSRQGKLGGDAPGGGLGTTVMVGAQHGKGSVIGSVQVGHAALSQASPTSVERVGGAVVAARVSGGGTTAGFVQLFGGVLSGGSIGIERRSSPQLAEFFSAASLGLVYTRTEDEMIGDGQFIGVELGVLMGLSTRPPR